MPSKIVFPEDFRARIHRLGTAIDDAGEIMATLERLAWEDNRDGLLAGKDKDGVPFVPIKESTRRTRRSATGTADPDAPPLIPARERSRAIANYQVASLRKSRASWVILGQWLNVLSAKGVPFLPYHFSGTKGRQRRNAKGHFMAGFIGRLPKRDADGIRPEGREKIRGALRDWLRSRITK
jgi:hypothetical protein